MNRLVVPPSPNWYNAEILACAPDNTLIYGSKNDLVIIRTIPGCEPYQIKFVDQAHKQRVISVDNNIQWGLPNKWVVSSGEDNYVKLWNIDKLENIYSHDVHKENKCKIVGAKFQSENKVLSVSENGVIYIWHPLTKECTKLSFVFPMKVTVKCFSPCPHASYITAFGLKSGLIVVANIKKSGSILFKLRGHTSEVVSLSWCPAPFNIFSSKSNNYIKDNKPEVETQELLITNEKIEKPSEGNENESKESPEESLESEKVFENHSKDNKHERDHDSKIKKKEILVNEVVNGLQEDEKLKNIPSISISEEKNDLDNESNAELINEKEENNVKLSSEEDESKICEESENQSSEDKINTTVSSEEVEVANYLLASSGRDNNVYIWRAGSDGRIQSVFKIPEKKAQQYRSKSKESWVVLKWITPSILLATSDKGEVLKYTLPTTPKNKKQGVVVHNDHRSIIFSIAAYVPLSTDENWRSKNETKFWTFGRNLYLFNTVLDAKSTHLKTLETLCAVVYCSAQSPLDPNRIAFGLSNGTIKIWNANDPNIKTFSTIHYSNKIHSRITYLAFHPKEEQMLAFCTDEGTIGLLDIYKLGPVKFFKQTFANTVHKIQWGPRLDEKVFLYAVGEGQLICFKADSNSSKAQPLKIALPEETHVYSFAWKLDYSMMILVDYTGKIMVLSSDLNVKATYYQSKRLLYLTWHPDSEAVSDEVSERSYWLAAAIDHSVYIFDFAEVSDKNGTLNIQDITKTILNGHKSNIKCLAWSPFNGDKLVSAGEDGLAHVWDVTTKQIISSFYEQNFQPLRSIIWSPVQEDILICSVANASLVIWKMSDYPAPLNEEVMEKYNKHMKKEKKCVSSRVEVSADSVLKKIKKSKKDVIFPSILPSNLNSSETVNLLRELLDRKLNGADKKMNDIPNFMQIFGDKEYILKILNIAEASHIEKGKHEAASMVSFWKGDLQSSIKEAIEQRRVSPLLISLAPTVSLSMWQKACETYASQLEDNQDSDPLEMATYYMASQNIEKAITTLCDKEMFKYALCLAKCRLPEDNVFVEDILKKWATFSTNCGALELAAQCHIMLGNFEEAAKILFRRSDLDILNFALDLAKKSNDAEIINALEYRVKAFAKEDGIHEDTKPLPDIKELVLENIKKEKHNGTELGENMKDGSTEGNQANFEIVLDHQDVETAINK
ncbi:hypothetical protein WA026_014063 [Henosepilachna vigintioctopunctata]|uniref:Gem-associated protein 5 n=1 Tax=Henosepilachna vigintioctopunctata TaxID=420089 RepID=A0AAW1U7P5_9CUCU